MNISRSIRVAALGVCATLCSTLAFAQIDARMFRQPAVSKDQIVGVSDELTLTSVGIRGPGSDRISHPHSGSLQRSQYSANASSGKQYSQRSPASADATTGW